MNAILREGDVELVESCIKGDLTAWASLAKKYSRLIHVSIQNRLKKYGFPLPIQDVEDIKQDMLAYIWKERKLEDVRNRRDISYWLAIVAGNAAMAHIRKDRKLADPGAVRIFDKHGETELIEMIPAAALSPAEELSREETIGRIDKVMEILPPKERLIAKLNLYHGKKYHEIADILKMPRGTVSSYLKRAKEKLRKELKDLFPPRDNPRGGTPPRVR